MNKEERSKALDELIAFQSELGLYKEEAEYLERMRECHGNNKYCNKCGEGFNL